MVVPPHLPLSPRPVPFETPVDTTRFVDLDDAETRLEQTDTVKLNFAVRGKVSGDPYPFTFSSGTALGWFFSSCKPTAYTGIGIRRDAVAVYEHVLSAVKLVSAVNETLAASTKMTSRGTEENVKAELRAFTSRTLAHILELKRLVKLADPSVIKMVGSFPLTIWSSEFKALLFGMWEEAWATAFQTSGSDAVAFSPAAVMTAAAAVHYYTAVGQLQCIKTAKARLDAVTIGYITQRAAEARRQKQTGELEIPWPRDTLHKDVPGFKYTALCLIGLGSFLARRPPQPPSDRYAPAYRQATMLVTNVYDTLGPPKSMTIDAAALLESSAAAWVSTGEAPGLGRVAHPATAAITIWEADGVPEQVTHLLPP